MLLAGVEWNDSVVEKEDSVVESAVWTVGGGECAGGGEDARGEETVL